jgi:prepilin-type N-terminal cleavage/methylation domain-containing protein/prepilin-type processing-associated H-X9-DG protein
MRRLRNSINGFSLTELLVVIAIIAVLASILFPVFSSARERARQATCQSNEKQLGIAFLSYVEDYDEQWPTSLSSSQAALTPAGNEASINAGIAWGSRVYPYVKNTAIYHCPDDPTEQTTNLQGDGETDYPVSYAYNCNIAAEGSLAKFSAPTATVVLVEDRGVQSDVTNWNHEPGAWNGWYGNGDNLVSDATFGNGATDWNSNAYLAVGAAGIGNQPPLRVTYAAHSGGSNWLLADGHVKWIEAQYVSAGRDAQGPPWAAPASSLSAPYVATFSAL